MLDCLPCALLHYLTKQIKIPVNTAETHLKHLT